MKRLFIAAILGGVLAVVGFRGALAEMRIGDPARGETIYGRCVACHSLTYNRTGPKHCGLFGRAAGSLDGFTYSSAMRQSGLVWTEATLDAFLENPRATVPRTTMGYAGIKDPQERADLIAYLRHANAPGGECF